VGTTSAGAQSRTSVVSRRDRLTVQQERQLVIATEAGDPQACRQLVEAFLPDINALAHRFRQPGEVEQRELVQEGVSALLFAARRYDAERETPFWGYAAFWVRKAMQELVADLTRAVALSDRAVRGLAAVRSARNEHLQRHGQEPTSEELARETGLPRAQVGQLLAADRQPRSLEARLDRADAVGTVGDGIPDPAAESAFDVVLDDIELGEVHALVEALDERELTVIRAHYGLGGPTQTLTQIGTSLGLSAERARQIESAALAKLRALLVQPALTRDSP
jgi:RNA polymerase primary sigma factor